MKKYSGKLLLWSLVCVFFVAGAQADDVQTLSLAEAVGYALVQNPDLESMQFNQRASTYQKHEAQSAYLPQISYAFELSKNDSDLFSFDASSLPAPFDQIFDFSNMGFTGAYYSNRFTVSQLIYDRSVLGQIKLADMQETASYWQTAGRRQEVVYQTVNAYLTILLANELLEVQRQRLELAERQWQTAKSSFDAGLRIRTDVLRAELARSSAQRDIVSAEIAQENAQVLLNQYTGLDLQLRHRFFSDALARYNPPPDKLSFFTNKNDFFMLARARNPSIKLSHVLVDQSRESIDIARGEFYPTVSAGTSFGYKDMDAPHLEDQEWGVQAMIEFPLFDGGRRLLKVRRTTQQFNAEQKRHESTVRSVLAAVEQALLALQEQFRNLEIAIKAETVAKENYERFQSLYKEGLADSLDITQALTELVVAQTDVVRSRYTYLKIYANLLLATGTIPMEEESYEELDWLN
jgi:outer membrane protein